MLISLGSAEGIQSSRQRVDDTTRLSVERRCVGDEVQCLGVAASCSIQ